ncbi:phosphatidylinositol-specific phospholipase C domain-containing protein [Daeguia caeni]|uniref:1-phosphatidylinositol phosphodiesterase n=1 Tax=Daeguia caeni TaxID=439612 RepID=A0ABV9H3W2_9HYPH
MENNLQIPKLWNADGISGDIYIDIDSGYYFKLLVSGNPSKNNWTFPPGPQTTLYWQYISNYADSSEGTLKDPKVWTDDGQTGDIYICTESGLYFQLQESGNPSENGWQFPASAQDNDKWKFVYDISVKPRGSYLNPRSWNEYGDAGDIYYYPSYYYYFKLKISGNPAIYNRYFPIKPENNDYWTFYGGLGTGVTDWMAAIPDNMPLSHLSIPGTHDSSTYTYDDALLKGWVRTQNWSIAEQLNNGIRFLDLRFGKYSNNRLGMFHGSINLNLPFSDVLSTCIDFLDNHPRETIIMRVKRENSNISDSELIQFFNNEISGKEKYIWQGIDTPKLGEVRNKIVIFSQVAGMRGIPWEYLDIEDDYEGGLGENYISKKKALINDHLVKSTTTHKINKKTIFVTFISMNPETDITETNYKISTTLNSYTCDLVRRGIELNSTLTSNDMPYLGIISMDFPDNCIDVIHAIIKYNTNNVVNKSNLVRIACKHNGSSIFTSPKLKDNDTRMIYSWYKNSTTNQNEWKLVHAYENCNYLFNTYYKEFLYSVETINEESNPVYTCISGLLADIDDSFLWYFNENGGFYTIKNKLVNAYLYVTSEYGSCNGLIVDCRYAESDDSNVLFAVNY